jgi:hypothetical protein
MDVFGHDYIAVDAEVVVLTDSFQSGDEGISGFCGSEVGSTLVTAEG